MPYPPLKSYEVICTVPISIQSDHRVIARKPSQPFRWPENRPSMLVQSIDGLRERMFHAEQPKPSTGDDFSLERSEFLAWLNFDIVEQAGWRANAAIFTKVPT